MENNENLIDIKEDDLKFRPLKVENPFSGNESNWFPLVNLDTPNINNFINNFIFGFSTPIVPGKIDDNFYKDIKNFNDNQNYMTDNEANLDNNFQGYNGTNMGYNQPEYDGSNMGYNQPGYNGINMGYNQPGYNGSNMGYNQPEYDGSNMGYNQPGYNGLNMGYNQPGYNGVNMGYNQPGYNGSMGYNQPEYDVSNMEYNQPGYDGSNMGYNQAQNNSNNEQNYNNLGNNYQQYPKESYGEELISYEKGYINDFNSNLNRKLELEENIKDLPHIKILKEYNFLELAEENLRNSNKKETDNIFSRIENMDNSILNIFDLYEIPYPIATVIVKKIINDALDYK